MVFARRLQSGVKQIFSWIAAIGFIFLCSCGATDSGAEENSRLILSRSEIEIQEGESFRLTTTFKPVSERVKVVVWRSADSAIATVEDGLVTGIQAGETFITAQTNEKTVSCKVVVKSAKKDEKGNASGKSVVQSI
ncbi:MAG: Ig-like domain-containing protein [Clostridia bacterium]|nr:Ig-like domain-containing protein [Clostridia bacterium]